MGVAIVVCDRVITEIGTMNKTLVSTFNTINSSHFPCAHPSLAVYVTLTNATGEKEVKLSLKKDEKQFLHMGGKVKFDAPNNIVELIFNFRNLVFPEPGVYCFEVSADDEYIFETRFNVKKLE